MKSIQKKFTKGSHVIALPISEVSLLNDLFPDKIVGSGIEVLTKDGKWSRREIISIKGNRLESPHFSVLYPLQTIRLTLKRDITINWKVSFTSLSGNKEKIVTFDQDVNLENALNLAQLSALVYCDENTIKKTIETQYKHIKKCQYISKTSYQQLAKNSLYKLLYVFFKGKRKVVDLQFLRLQSEDPDNGDKIISIIFKGSKEPQDWMTNFTISDARFHHAGLVHKGFYDAVKIFMSSDSQRQENSHKRQTIIKRLKSIDPNTKIILAGHSLGGALATLAGCKLLELGVSATQLSVCTFGAPPVGSKPFCDYYHDKLPINRFANEKDIFTKIDKFSKYFHLGDEITLPSNENEMHCCNGYIDNLIDCINNDSQQQIRKI